MINLNHDGSDQRNYLGMDQYLCSSFVELQEALLEAENLLYPAMIMLFSIIVWKWQKDGSRCFCFVASFSKQQDDYAVKCDRICFT